MATFDVPTLEARLEAIRLLSSEEVQDLALQILHRDSRSTSSGLFASTG